MELYNQVYGAAIVPSFDPAKHNVVINSAASFSGAGITVVYNSATTCRGSVTFYTANTAMKGGLATINVTVSDK